MNLLEYEAKKIVARHNIPVPASQLIERGQAEAVALPAVLKSQVPIGGRGKLGGIRVVESDDDVESVVDELFELEIRGFKPSVLLAEEKLKIDREFYLSMLIDRASASLQMVAHPNGGVEVESHAEDDIWKVAIGDKSGWAEVVGQQLADLFDTAEQTFVLQDLVENLHECFVKNDATLIEINPLVLTTAGKLVAGDCKMTLDDAAAFRHPEWNFEQTISEVNFVSLDANGTVATIANGAGLAMATVDAVADADMRPANFLDVGGGANADSVLEAFRRIAEYPNVRAIVINIFAGITRCDEIAKAIIEAQKQLANLPPLCIRLAGTNYDEAKVLLDNEGIALLPTLKQCLEAAEKEVNRG